jgi:hypothetical protein
MSKRVSTPIITKSSEGSNQAGLYEKAIADARELIQGSRREQAELERSIRLLVQLRDSGAPFPGQPVEKG